MVHSEYIAKCALYGKWKYAQGQQTARETYGMLASIFAAYAANLKWDFWLWTALTFVSIYVCCTFRAERTTDLALDAYNNYPYEGCGDYFPPGGVNSTEPVDQDR